MTNEIQFFGTNQKDAFQSLANKLIDTYNSLDKQNTIHRYDFRRDRWFKNIPLQALILKVEELIFSHGDPLSVPVFLKRVSNGKIVGLGKPEGDAFSRLEDNFIGFGHFRMGNEAWKLSDLELKALRIYLKGQFNDYETTEFKYKNLVISSKLIASGVEFPNTKDGGLHNRFYITVKNTENESVTGFDFYGSTHDYNNGNTEIKGEDLLNAFECFISDAMAGEQDFEDFCNEFGYDSDSRTAERIHKECIKSLNKAKSILDTDIYDFANELQETINN